MQSLLLLPLVFAAVFSLSRVSDDEIVLIKSKAANWKAGRTPFTDNPDALKIRCGVNMEENGRKIRDNVRIRSDPLPTDGLPEEFDARTKWPHCDSIKEIRDQSNCASCWAFGSVEAMSDRICIATGKNVNISAEEVMTCSLPGGCNGGFTFAAWHYYATNGTVSGGLYNSHSGCEPYKIPPCPPELPKCHRIHPTPQCNKTCEAGYNKTFLQDKHFGKEVYGVKGVEQIMNEIYTKGPVTATFQVFKDFTAYKGGVYKHVWGKFLDGHAVKIIGWGVEKGEDYWLIANSWTAHWGEKGFFKMLKGVNECNIESQIITGEPKKN